MCTEHPEAVAYAAFAAEKADRDNDEAWLAERRPRVMEAEDIGLTPCMEGEHPSWDEFPDEPDVGFHGYRQCKECGHCEALPEWDEFYYEEE